MAHSGHDHTHGDGCGHPRVQHGDHSDYAHDGHLHNPHGDHVDEHALAGAVACNDHDCSGHADDHAHGDACGHPAVPHDDHRDYVVGDHLHHRHGDHCDRHGAVTA